jgi:peptidoglycan-N-acetylglucosamine deacetylase
MIQQLRSTLGIMRNRLLGTIHHVETTEPLAAITFDDGPHPDYTRQILDILSRHNARATFFVRGERAAQYPEIIREMADAGHLIGNHSWSHPSFPSITLRSARSEIRACGKFLSNDAPRLFRFPYGHQTVQHHIDAVRLGYQVIGWSLNTGDWEDPQADAIADAFRGGLQPGQIILMHDELFEPLDPRLSDRKPTIQALQAILDEFGDHYEFVTASELIRRGRPYYQRVFNRPDYSMDGGGEQ